MRPTKVALELPGEVSPEFAAWPGFLPGLLPELTWVPAADADLVISALGPDGQGRPGEWASLDRGAQLPGLPILGAEAQPSLGVRLHVHLHG